MFCRYCGKKIPTDSIFCPICGKMIGTPSSQASQPEVQPQTETQPRVEYQPQPQAQAQPRAHSYRISPTKAPSRSPLDEDVPTILKREDTYKSRNDQSKKTSPQTVTALIMSSIALVTFLVFFFNMAPGYNVGKIICYAISVLIAICLYVFAIIRIKRRSGRRFSQAVIIVSASLTALIVILNVVYLAKADDVIKSSSPQDTIDVTLDIDESFFSRAYGGNVVSPYAYIEISGVRINDNEVFTAMTDVKYGMTVVCGHSQGEGKAELDLTIPSECIIDGYTTEVSIDIGATQYAEVMLTFKKSVSFWQVVFG